MRQLVWLHVFINILMMISIADCRVVVWYVIEVTAMDFKDLYL